VFESKSRVRKVVRECRASAATFVMLAIIRSIAYDRYNARHNCARSESDVSSCDSYQSRVRVNDSRECRSSDAKVTRIRICSIAYDHCAGSIFNFAVWLCDPK